MDLDHLNLPVLDAQACRAFYEQHFGFRLATVRGGGQFLQNDDGFLLVLAPVTEKPALPDGFHIGFTLGSADEVQALHGSLRAAGIPTAELIDVRPEEDYVTFRCWDPDGTEIEVFWEV